MARKTRRDRDLERVSNGGTSGVSSDPAAGPVHGAERSHGASALGPSQPQGVLTRSQTRSAQILLEPISVVHSQRRVVVLSIDKNTLGMKLHELTATSGAHAQILATATIGPMLAPEQPTPARPPATIAAIHLFPPPEATQAAAAVTVEQPAQQAMEAAGVHAAGACMDAHAAGTCMADGDPCMEDQTGARDDHQVEDQPAPPPPTTASDCTEGAASQTQQPRSACTTTTTTTTTIMPPAPWEKVLWKEQPYPDNYVDHTFLQDLVVNAQLPQREYAAVVLDAVAVSQQLSLAAAAVVAPVHLRAGTLTARQLLVLDAVLLVMGYAVCALLGGHLLGGTLARGLRQGVLLVGGVFFLSPLLRTLAATVSGDSVVALTVVALITHLFLHDYSFVNSSTDKLSGTLALAAAALSAVLVASMMPSELHVFAQVLFALELFMLSPFVRRYVRCASTPAHACSAVMLVALTAAGIAVISAGLSVAYVCTHLILVFACPWALVSITKYKAKINGPWDEAVPHLPQQLNIPTDAMGNKPTDAKTDSKAMTTE